MSSTKEELQELRECALEILTETGKVPKKLVIDYDYHEGVSGGTSTSTPRLEIEWEDGAQ